jgi:hypothetical protein
MTGWKSDQTNERRKNWDEMSFDQSERKLPRLECSIDGQYDGEQRVKAVKCSHELTIQVAKFLRRKYNKHNTMSHNKTERIWLRTFKVLNSEKDL